MKEKTYKTIIEVSKILNLNIHIIRYWDSKLSISKQSNTNKKKFFNNHNIEKLRELKETLYLNGKYNYSLDLAKRILNKKDVINLDHEIKSKNKFNIDKLIKIRDNLNKILKVK